MGNSGGLEEFGNTPSEFDAETKESLFDQKNIAYVTISTDLSLGADIVTFAKNKIIVVDGAGSGKDGRRDEAIELSEKLKSDGVTPSDRTYLVASVTDNERKIKITARSGGCVVAYQVDDETSSVQKLIPKVVYYGTDSHSQLPTSVLLDAKKTKHLVMLTDGGVLLLGDSRLFGDSSVYRPSFKNIADALERRKSDQIEKIQVMENYLLQPLTVLINNTDPAEINSVLQLKISKLRRDSMNWNEDDRLTDDATFVFATLNSSSRSANKFNIFNVFKK